MLERLNKILDILSDYLAHRKGLLPLIGAMLVVLNAILQFTTLSGWVIEGDVFLHLGIIIAIFGFMLAWAL